MQLSFSRSIFLAAIWYPLPETLVSAIIKVWHLTTIAYGRFGVADASTLHVHLQIEGSNNTATTADVIRPNFHAIDKASEQNKRSSQAAVSPHEKEHSINTSTVHVQLEFKK